MRLPKADRHAKKILQLQVNHGSDAIIRITEILREAIEKNPFDLPKDQKERAVKMAIAEGFDDIEAAKLIRAASQTMNMLDSGYKIFQSDAVLDSLVKEAQKHMFKKIYDKDGNYIDEQFDPNMMNAITRAVKAKADTLLKAQSNLIQAQKEAQTEKENTDIDITELERDQLERFIAGEIMEHQEILQIVNKKKEDGSMPSFHEELDE